MKFIPITGSLIGGRSKDKKERISEALTDLQIAIRGLGTESYGPCEGHEMAQMLGAFARICSVFLRKLVLGSRGKGNSRLLDKTVMESLNFDFQPLRRIQKERRRTIETGFGVGGGFMELTKVDDPGPGPAPTYRLPFTPHDLNIVIEWPLPGAADWVGLPSESEPWTLSAGQLFDTGSTRSMNCDDWLGQQIVNFNGKLISLREIIQTVANLEGAHAINVGPLARAPEHKLLKAARNLQRDILNSITLFGIRYTHLIVIETALYLYGKLLDEPSIQRPLGDIYIVTPGFDCPVEQAKSPRPNWLRYDGEMIMEFSSEPKAARFTIKPVI